MSRSKEEYPKGIMEQIQRLIAPPPPSKKDSSRKKSISSHKYFKKPGKQHNRDYCYTCDEGGSLICCDVCPLSFHLGCLDPPMEEDDIPEGEWTCKACSAKESQGNKGEDTSNKKSKKRKQNQISFKSEKNKSKAPQIKKSSLSENPVEPKQENVTDFRASPLEAVGHEDKDPSREDLTEDEERLCIRKAWEALIEAAKNQNPKAYMCDEQYRTVPYHFPGDKKVSTKNRKGVKHHNVPSHSRVCFNCQRGCSYQPLLACDYCPNSFHLDCLDPPLTIAPKTYWMCPLHIEPFLEKKFFNKEPTLSQRIALWDMLRQPLDQEAIKLDFLRKINTEDGGKMTEQTTSCCTPKIKVPDFVVGSYQTMPDQIPSLKSTLGLDGYEKALSATRQMEYITGRILKEKRGLGNVLNREQDLGEELNTNPPSKEDQELWLESFLQIQRDCALLMTKDDVSQEGLRGIHWDNLRKLRDSSSYQQCAEESITSLKEENTDSSEKIKSSEKVKDPKKWSFESNISNTSNGGRSQTKQDQLFDKIVKEAVANTPEGADALSILAHLDSTVVSLLAFQRICQIINFKNVSDMPRNSYEFMEPTKENTGSIETESENTFEKFLEICDQLLTETGEKDLHSETDSNQIEGEGTEMDPVAALGSLDEDCDEVVPITKKSITVGSDCKSELDLSKYGHCNFISSVHAVIYYDEIRQRFEILSYSPYGTRVDNVLLSMAKPSSASNSCKTCPVHKVIENSKTKHINSEETKSLFEHLRKKYDTHPCKCNVFNKEEEMNINGWEGSAPLQHGSLLQFGCRRFVFSEVAETKSKLSSLILQRNIL